MNCEHSQFFFTIGTDVLDHLGLLATTVDKLGVSKKIDEILPLTQKAKTTMGQRVSTIIYNAFGFIDDIHKQIIL